MTTSPVFVEICGELIAISKILFVETRNFNSWDKYREQMEFDHRLLIYLQSGCDQPIIKEFEYQDRGHAQDAVDICEQRMKQDYNRLKALMKP